MSLGRLTRVPLRNVWEREDTDFTPWLAEDANITLLGEAIGIELEVLEQEAGVGPFRADIRARDAADDSIVVIENQLERTDHSHLGQILTYAAGLDAVTVIWIAANFTEEHRAAIDWLNRITHEDFRFFGIEIELWQIGGSNPAPRFNLIAKPNNWSKSLKESSRNRSGTLTAGQTAQLAFWQAFGATITAKGRNWTVPKPQPSSWVGYGIGRSGVGLCPTISVSQGWVAVRLYTDEAVFQALLRDRAAIEQALGVPASWLPKPGRSQCAIESRHTGDPNDPATREALITWMLDTMDTYNKVFRPRIQALPR